MQPGKKFETFEDLEVYQVSRTFRKSMYRVASELPDIEKFGLASQVRRAAVSLTNNIAEGHGRFHYLDQIRFTLQARGSLQELIDDLNVCEDETYLPRPAVTELKALGWRVAVLIGGYIRFLRQRKTGESLALHERPAADGSAEEFELFDFPVAPDSTIQPFNDSTN